MKASLCAGKRIRHRELETEKYLHNRNLSVRMDARAAEGCYKDTEGSVLSKSIHENVL